jgi:hypothetical protein
MKKAIVTGAALLTTLGGATAVGAAAALPAAASTGCGVTIHVHNQTNSAIKVQWAKSDSRAHLRCVNDLGQFLGLIMQRLRLLRSGSW